MELVVGKGFHTPAAAAAAEGPEGVVTAIEGL